MSKIPLKEVTYSFKVRRSKFTGILVPVQTQQEVSEMLADLRKKHYEANHVCWAYRIYENRILRENASDAGEPAGTAGLPILNGLKQQNIVNAVCYVIRIFGGQKLGKPGLIEAYGECASQTIELGKYSIYQLTREMKIISPIDYYGSLMHLVDQAGGTIKHDLTAAQIEWVILFPENKIEGLAEVVRDITHGEGHIKSIGVNAPTREG